MSWLTVILSECRELNLTNVLDAISLMMTFLDPDSPDRDVIFHSIGDPANVAGLVNALRKSEAQKQKEKEEATH